MTNARSIIERILHVWVKMPFFPLETFTATEADLVKTKSCFFWNTS